MEIGEVNINTYGTKMKIIAARSNDDIDIQFLDENHYIKEHNTYSNFKSGQVKNPYDKSRFNIGYIGVGDVPIKINGKVNVIYSIWGSMLERCYGFKERKRHPTYYGKCTVCEEWHCFQTFAKWYIKESYPVNGRLHIDKDILISENTVYSPSTCLLMPQRINELFTVRRNKEGMPQCIRTTKTGRYSVSYGGINLGICDTYEDACEKYKTAKKNKIIEVAIEYKDIIPRKAYDALMNYEVIIQK